MSEFDDHRNYNAPYHNHIDNAEYNLNTQLKTFRQKINYTTINYVTINKYKK